MQPIQLFKSHVALVGAGPGDPDLLTVKAAKLLREADVVITDRLVSEEILRSYVRPEASVFHVGKQCRKGMSTPQQTINDLIVEYALRNKRVVRLKGGDVSIFSNILDELQTLHEHHIPYEIVPGITAATGAAAYTGIPLTARGYSTAVRLLTYYKKTVVADSYWKELAETDDTLVFYMSGDTATELVQQLTQNNIPSDRGIAIIEQATTPLQHVRICGIYDFEKELPQEPFLSPTLIIVGKVVHLHQTYGWRANSEHRELYFKPVGQANQKNGEHVSRA